MFAPEVAAAVEETAVEKVARLQAEASAGWWQRLWTEAVEIWGKGGWAMWAIAVIALLIFGTGIHVWLGLRATGFTAVPERKWRWWIEHPRERTGPIGRMLDFVTGGRSTKDTAFFFQQLRSTELPPFERDLKIVKTAVAAAPLVGLLGTVTGMLATFGALSTGSGGDQTMEKIAEGISEALITTETGLVVALPGVFFQYQLTRTYERYAAFLAHLESVCAQTLHRRARKDREKKLRDAAMDVIRHKLAARAS